MKKPPKRKATTMRLPEHIRDALAERAAKEGRSASNLTIQLLKEGLKNRKRLDKRVGNLEAANVLD